MRTDLASAAPLVSVNRLMACILGLATTTSMGHAQRCVVSWARRLDTHVGVIDPASALGAPDGMYASFDGPPAPAATYSAFEPPHSAYDGSALASLLGIPTTALSRADFIVFESNGNLDLPFERSSWMFSDGTSSITLDHDPSSPDGAYPVLAVQGISGAAYSSYFGFAPQGGFVQALLFRLPATIDLRSPTFTVTVSAPGNPPDASGSPDPDAMGVIRTQKIRRR